MSREELVEKIQNLRFISISLDELLTLEYNDLYLIYMANKSLKYYDGLKKQHLISGITMVNEDHTRLSLWKMGYEDIIKIYLKEFNLTPSKFKGMILSSVENFKTVARENNDEEYLSFTSDEMIIASGVLIPDSETVQNLKESKLKKDIADLEETLEIDEGRLKDCSPFEEAEIYGDISYDADRLRKKEEQLATLMEEYQNNIRR